LYNHIFMNKQKYCERIQRMGLQADRAALPKLLAAMDDSSPRIRRAAAQSLGRLADKRAIKVLRRCLESDPSGRVRVMAVRALGWIGGEDAIHAVGKALADKSSNVRLAAVVVFGWNGSETSGKYLVQALLDEDTDVRRLAANLLICHNGNTLPGKLCETALPALLTAFYGPDRDTRWVAGTVLQQIGMTAVPGLEAALQSPDLELQRIATSLLGNMVSM
jgi:HEAT repeat protein